MKAEREDIIPTKTVEHRPEEYLCIICDLNLIRDKKMAGRNRTTIADQTNAKTLGIWSEPYLQHETKNGPVSNKYEIYDLTEGNKHRSEEFKD